MLTVLLPPKRLRLEKPPGVELFDVLDRGTHLELAALRVLPESRGTGLGSRCVRQLKSFKRTIRLVGSPERGKGEALLRFYRRHGFQFTHNPEIPNEMEWKP